MRVHKMADTVCVNQITVVSYNMHGFNQGYVTMDELINSVNPDVFLCQEHWLTPANLHKFDDRFSNYFCFGCSAMMNKIETGPLSGRPYGGIMVLIKKSLRSITETIHFEERFAIIKIANYIFINVYLPCEGSKDRNLICETLLADIMAWREQYCHLKCLIAGDFNANLNIVDNAVVKRINKFASSLSLFRSDVLFPNAGKATYISSSLQNQSYIDYMLISCCDNMLDFSVYEPDINYSDHLPIMCTLACCFDRPNDDSTSAKVKCDIPACFKLRWDKADPQSYYLYTGAALDPILKGLDSATELFYSSDDADISSVIDNTYDDIVNVLNTAANLYVPTCRKNFFKFWWDEELATLKQAAIESNKIWKAAGKPKQGPIFEKRQSSKASYRRAVRNKDKQSTSVYTNALHESLINKDGPSFWKCWRSKFNTRMKCNAVGGCVDDNSIANNFAQYFSQIYTPNSSKRAAALRAEYNALRTGYFGFPMTDDHFFTTELISKVINELKCGRAADIDGLMAEHLIKAHPALPVILSKLFRLIVLSRHVPTTFGYSYIVPIPKSSVGFSKPLNCEDFRGIAISPIISKVFEYCFLNKLGDFLSSKANQFGFKKGLGCNHAIYTVRKIVERLTSGGNTVNLCSIDLSKAFDKVNHHGLLIKLMKRNLPLCFLEIIEHWLNICHSVVKWNSMLSYAFVVKFGVRQGSVLSPFLFAVYLDDIWVSRQIMPSYYIIIYADDILLVSSSICELQRIFDICERELMWLDMVINVKYLAACVLARETITQSVI